MTVIRLFLAAGIAVGLVPCLLIPLDNRAMTGGQMKVSGFGITLALLCFIALIWIAKRQNAN